jgi:FAD/FMN-containing dehydrogenase
VVPQGGNTGLVGGGVPRGGEVVVSTRRLTAVLSLDATAREVVAGAGITLAALNAQLSAHGLRIGVDLASRESATIGGMVATNAGGINVLRHGMMRAQVAGLEVVLADGSIIDRLSGLKRDNTGYDLPGLLAGSEGTLGVISRVRLRCVPVYARRSVALLGAPSMEQAILVAKHVQSSVSSLNAAECFFARGLQLVRRHAGLSGPFARDYPVYVLLETASDGDTSEALASALSAFDLPDAVLETEAQGRARLWAFRERHTEAINAEGVPHKLDVALPPGRLAEFAARVQRVATAADPAADVVLFGHIADGNLHVNILGLDADDECVDDAVLRLVAEMGGSISAEHGIGIAKRDWLSLTRGLADIAAMRAIKHAMDPAGILNPGVIFTE